MTFLSGEVLSIGTAPGEGLYWMYTQRPDTIIKYRYGYLSSKLIFHSQKHGAVLFCQSAILYNTNHSNCLTTR